MNHEIHVGSSLPPGWNAFSLGSQASFVTSGSRGWARFYSESGDLFLRSQNIRSGHLDLEDRQHVLPPTGAEGERTRVQPNDLLVTITGNSVGNVAISSEDLGIAYISQHVGMIRLVNPSLAPYACWYLSPGAPGNRQIMDAQTGQSKPGLNLQNLKELVVAAPKDKRERDLIVAALDDIQAQADEMRMLLSKKRMLKQAAMQELLTGKRRLPGFEGEWEVKRLGDVVQILKGQLITSDAVLPGDIPVIAGGRQPAYYHSAANRSGRTITISASGASAGFVALYDEPIFASDCSTISESEGYCLDFLFYQLLSKQQTIYKAQTGGAQPHIHAKDLSPIAFSFPTLPEQTAIAKVLTEMDAELTALEQRREKTRALKQGMMQELLTGRTRQVRPENGGAG